MDKFAVFGNPIAQSKSPEIHRMFAQQTDVELEYDAILSPVDSFESELAEFFSDPNSKGCNVTVPFKERAARWADSLSDSARISGAVNTLIRTSDGIRGDNTDGFGLVTDLQANGVVLAGQNILLLGAGGAARGVLPSLLAEQPAAIIIANRTEERAIALAEIDNAGVVRASGFSNLQQTLGNESVSVLINSTSASLSGNLPDIDDEVVASAQVVYDMVYGSEPTVLMRHAARLGVEVCLDGLGMLVAQAAKSFTLWTGKTPDAQATLQSLRADL